MNNTQEQGFTLLELLTALAIIGVLSAITTPLVLWANKPLQNGTYQAAGIFSQGRSRAISTTSSLRIQPDPSDPERSFLVQASDTRSCDPNTTALTSSVTTDSNQLAVVSTQGFAAGDRLKIGDDETENVVLTTDNNSSVLTLGKPIGTSHSSGTAVEIVSNWSQDKTFFEEDMTLPSTVKMAGNMANWELCFDSRGIATVSDAFGIAKDDLEITIISEQSQKEGKITVFQGGMIDSVVIQPKQEIVVAAADVDTSTSDSSSTPDSGSSSAGNSSGTTGGSNDNTSNSTPGDNGTSSDTSDSSTDADGYGNDDGYQESESNTQLEEGVTLTSNQPNSSTGSANNTVATNDTATTDNTTSEDNTAASNEPSFDDENLTFEQKREVYRDWLDNNEYYQSIIQGSQTLDRDSEPYRTFVKEIIEKLTWLYS